MELESRLYRAAFEVQRFLESQGLPHCLIGGVAILRWGNPRQTMDFDLCVLTGWEGTEDAIERLCARYPTRMKDASDFALRNRVLLLKMEDGTVQFDVVLGALPFEEEMIRRSSLFEFAPGLRLRTCSAEDLIIMKCFAGRAVDLMDVTGVLRRNRDVLDMVYIRSWLSVLQEGSGAGDLSGLFERLLSEA